MAEAIQTEYYKEDQNMIAKDKKQNIIAEYGRTPVSYTHLTLPTIPDV